jgi:UDP-N-acetylglucosamine 3-dehydrogenase
VLGTETRPVRIGIVSLAHVHAYDYAVALGNLGNKAKFVGVTDEDEARGRSAANKYGVDFAAVSDRLYEDVDAVVICSENRDHARLAIDALEHGVHVLCEKPIATTASEA